MGADTSEKIRDVISFVHSRTLSIGVYSPGDTSVANMYEEAASDLSEIIQQEIAKARLAEWEQFGEFLCDADKRSLCKNFLDLYLIHGDRLSQTLKENKEQ